MSDSPRRPTFPPPPPPPNELIDGWFSKRRNARRIAAWRMETEDWRTNFILHRLKNLEGRVRRLTEPTNSPTPPENPATAADHTPRLEPIAFDQLDAGIQRFVRLLRDHGIETFESCEGGPGHAYPEPTVRFHGDCGAGFSALSVALSHDLPVSDVRQTWPVIDGRPTGPHWEMVFSEADPVG